MGKILVLFLMAGLVSVARAESDDGLAGKIGLGVDVASGNSELTAITADLELGYTAGLNIYSLAATYGYAETDEDLSRQNSRVSLKYDRSLTDLTYVYARAENEYDKIALIDYRLTAGPGIGVFFVKSESVSLKADAGISYIDQKLRDENLENNFESVIALRITERLEVELSETASIWQAAEYLPDTDDFNSYLLNLEVGLETSITGSTSLRLVAASRRQSMPPAGVEKEDVTLRAAVVVTSGG